MALDKVRGRRSNVLTGAKVALDVPVQVGHVQRDRDDHQHHPLQVETEEGDDEEDHPENGTQDEAGPEDFRLLGVDGNGRVLVPRLVHPMGDAVVIHVVPPSKADQYSAGYVLDRPEVGGEEQNHEHKTGDERVTEDATEQVYGYRCTPKDDVKEGDVWVSGSDGTTELMRVTQSYVEDLIRSEELTGVDLTCWQGQCCPPRQMEWCRRGEVPVIGSANELESPLRTVFIRTY